MLTPRKFSYFTVIIFSIVLIVHLMRIIYDWKFTIADWEVPMGLSWAAVIILAYLDYQGFKIGTKK